MNEEKPIGPEYPVLHHLGATVSLTTRKDIKPYQLGDLVSVDKDGKAYLAGTDFAHCNPNDYVIGHITEIRESYDANRGPQSYMQEVIVQPTPVQVSATFQAWEMQGMSVHNALGTISMDWNKHDKGQSIWQKNYNGYVGQIFGVNIVSS